MGRLITTPMRAPARATAHHFAKAAAADIISIQPASSTSCRSSQWEPPGGVGAEPFLPLGDPLVPLTPVSPRSTPVMLQITLQITLPCLPACICCPSSDTDGQVDMISFFLFLIWKQKEVFQKEEQRVQPVKIIFIGTRSGHFHGLLDY